MAFVLVTGGTAGYVDGTVVSSSNKVTFTTVGTPVEAFLRTDPETTSADGVVNLPTGVSISFTGSGGTYYSSGTNPNSVGATIRDVNTSVWLKQTASTGSTSGAFRTFGNFSSVSRTESEISGLSDQPVFCCIGPDSNVWVTCQTASGADQVNKVTPGGTVTAYAVPNASASVTGICSDGTDLWVTTDRSLLKVTTGGTFTTYTTGLTDSKREVVYHDSYLWMTDVVNHTIKKVDPATGTVSATYTPSGTTPLPYGICAGPDEAGVKYIWFTLYTANKIGKLKCSDGTITLYSVPTGSSGPVSICSDGVALWATNQITNKIIKCTTAGSMTEYSAPGSPAAGDPCHIAYGFDGRLWFTYSSNGSKIGSCDLNGTMGTVVSCTASSNPQDICSSSTAVYAPLYTTDKLAKVV